MLLADYASKDMTQKIYEILSQREDLDKRIKQFSPKALYMNRFAAGEIDIDIRENVRNKNIFLIKSPATITREMKGDISLEDLSYEPNASLMELLLINDALVRASANDIANIIPHMPYQRQDRRAIRKDVEENKSRKTRSPVSASLIGKLIQNSGADRIITFEPHFKQIEGLYHIPFDSLTSAILFAEYIEETNPTKENIVVVAPDVGAAENANILADMINVPLSIIRKRRLAPGVVSETNETINDIEIRGRDAYILDDIVDGAGTLANAANLLRKNGARTITACISHPILSGNAKERIKNAEINLVTLNTIPIKDSNVYPNIKIIDVAPLIAEAIYSICTDRELSSLFHDYKKYKERKSAGFGRR